MKKKYFTFVTILGALLIFSIVPIIHYMTDGTRVLHHDYNYRYETFYPNKLFLKTLYLLDNKDKYDTLVYGSSRGGFMDMTLISDKTYNMTHGFGNVSTYLQNLKVLLEDGVKIKNVWIGMNDYVIWKDNTDMIENLLYKNSFIGNFKIYLDWLFRKISIRDIKILKGEMPLLKSEYITDPHKRIERARIQEQNLLKFKERNIPAAMLGYTDIYRIDKAIGEIKEIKKICQENNIKLTAFFYPIYYATYLRYDQSKIEEFKRKLVSVIDFYDFYDVGEIALRQQNWFEGSHFVPSVGDFMIQNILNNNNFLVTQENIESRIAQTRRYLKNMPIMSTGGIYQLHKKINININSLKTIFDIHNNEFKYYKNDQFILEKHIDYTKAIVNNRDPMFILNKTKTKAKQTILILNIESSKKSVLQLYLKDKENSSYSEKNTYNISINKGINDLRVVIPSKYINNELRVDFTKDIGEYKIKKFIILEVQ